MRTPMQRMSRYITTAIIAITTCFLGCVVSASAVSASTVSAPTVSAPAEAAAALGHKNLRALTSVNGLSDLLVNVIYKDSTGYVWFGTESGVDRFDGNRLKSYPIERDPRNASRRIHAIVQGGSGNIFVGSNVGLFEIPAGSSTPIRIAQEKIAGAVSSLAYDGKGNLYVATDTGFYIYNEKKHEISHRLVVPDMMSDSNRVRALWLTPGAGLWILTPHELHLLSFATNSFETFHLDNNIEGSRLKQIADTLYISTQDSGVVPFDMKSRRFLTPIRLGNNVVTSICDAGNGNLLISTDGEGIFIYSPATASVVATISTHPGENTPTLRSNSIYSTLVDDKGRIWVGYYQSGVDYTPTDNTFLSSYNNPKVPDLRHTAVRALGGDNRQHLIGTHEGFYFIDDQTGTNCHVKKPQIASNLVFCAILWKGKFYIGTYHGGLYVFDPQTHATQSFGPPEMKGMSVFDLETDPQGRLWAATSAGVYRFNSPADRQPVSFTSDNSPLPVGNVYYIFFDSMNRGWLCTESGLAIWNGSGIVTRFPEGFPATAKIRAIYEDSRKQLYFVPDRGPIHTSNIELSKTETLSDTEANRTNMSTCVIEDLDGGLWIGTDKGLMHHQRSGEVSVINNLDGAAAPVFTLCKPQRKSNGDIWFGTANGLYMLDYEGFKKSKGDMPQITISDLRTNGRSIISRLRRDRHGMSLTLKNDESDLKIDLANFGFGSPEYFEVEYYIEGIDETWRVANGNSSIHYLGLPTGSHKLHLRYPGNSDSEMTIDVSRNRSSAWIIIMSASVIIALLLCAIVYRHIHERRKREDAIDMPTPESEGATSASETTPAKEEKKPSYRTTALTEEECKRILKRLEQLMKHERPYTNPDLKISDLATMTDTSSHALSYLFNQYLKTTYYDYINQYRVKEFQRLVRELDTSRYTLTALSQKCGFSSRASFFRHFKSITGITPSEYLKSNT